MAYFANAEDARRGTVNPKGFVVLVRLRFACARFGVTTSPVSVDE
jgi:hypothetical protein